ncbi:3-ketoacyl-CoA thiolase [Candidatus Burkholderia brachyanthoides]|nr:3-ketoacyl-CoA thiolase [Candidatus Burkholderia brachyanthoides]
MGCVLPAAGQRQAPARQAALGAELPLSVGSTTVNKMCGSGMRAAMFAHDMLLTGSADVIVAGGMRMGHGQVLDHMFLDGLEDAYDKGRLMGTFAEQCALSYVFSRESQNAFAVESLRRAQRANDDGSFKWEIAPVTVSGRKGDVVVDRDEQPFKANIEKVPSLKPAFAKDGTVTTANSSSISDGAAALVMMRASTAKKLGVTPLARVVGYSTFAQQAALFTTAPVGAIRKLFEKNDWRANDVDLYEINEAFVVVTMAAMREHDLPHDKVNVNGGACALEQSDRHVGRAHSMTCI